MHGYNAPKSLAAAALSHADPTGELTQCSGRLQAAIGGGEWKEMQGFIQPPRRGRGVLPPLKQMYSPCGRTINSVV